MPVTFFFSKMAQSRCSLHHRMPSLQLCWWNKAVATDHRNSACFINSHSIHKNLRFFVCCNSCYTDRQRALATRLNICIYIINIYIYAKLDGGKGLAYTAVEKMATLRTSSRQETRRQPSPFYTYVKVRQSIAFMTVNIPVTRSLHLIGRGLAKKAQFLIWSFQYHCYNEIPSRSPNLAHCSTWAIYIIMQTLKELA